jgi:hypothetical protein
MTFEKQILKIFYWQILLFYPFCLSQAQKVFAIWYAVADLLKSIKYLLDFINSV